MPKACTTLALWHECCPSGKSSFCLLCDFKELGVAKRPHPTTPTRIVPQLPLSRIVRADPKEPRPCPAETVSSRSSRWPASIGSHGFRHSNLWRCGCSLLNLRCDCPIVFFDHAPTHPDSWSSRSCSCSCLE